MRNLISIIALAMLVIACSPEEPTPNPAKESIFKAEFQASPAIFSAEGGVGTVKGSLQEVSSEGKVIKETPLAKEDFTVSLKSGDASQLSLDQESKEFTVHKGASSAFELEVIVTQGKAKGNRQILTVRREGALSYAFEAKPDHFTHNGGVGQVTGVCKVLDASGAVIAEEPLANDQFTLTLKQGDVTELTIDEAMKSFTVKPGNAETDFVLLAKGLTPGAVAEEIRIRRDAKPAPIIRTALDYVAEYNMNADGSNFVQTQDCDVSGYFTFDDAVSKFANITVAGTKYHLPSQKEWLSIIPLDRTPIDYINFTQTYKHQDVSESVSVGGQDVTSTNDYYAPGDGVVYALRYKGTIFVSAWRYEVISKGGQRVLKIRVRPLDKETTTVTVEEIGKTTFWTGDGEVVRTFPASGMKTSSGNVALKGSDGYFWAVTDEGPLNGWGMFFDASSSDVGRYRRNLQSSVRLFITKVK